MEELASSRMSSLTSIGADGAWSGEIEAEEKWAVMTAHGT